MMPQQRNRQQQQQQQQGVSEMNQTLEEVAPTAEGTVVVEEIVVTKGTAGTTQTLGEVHAAIQAGQETDGSRPAPSEEDQEVEDNNTSDAPPSAEENATVPQGHVTLAIKKSFTNNSNTTRRLAQLVASTTGATVSQNDDYYVITAPHILVRRADVEDAIGQLTSTKWRMMLVKREGEVKHITDTFFEMGAPLPTGVETNNSESIEYAAINTRIPKALKDDMVEMTGLMGYASQTEFIAVAIQELVNSIKAQI